MIHRTRPGVRRLLPGDGALLREIRLAALLDAPGAFASTYAREHRDTAEQWEDRIARFAWFAVGRHALVCGRRSAEGVPRRCDLTSMWVHPEHRGRGLAGELIAAVRDRATADGAREIALWVADGNNGATRAYSRAGFAPTGRRQPLPSTPDVEEEQWLVVIVP
jgi:GNAT superfamily N-acetyltransferase